MKKAIGQILGGNILSKVLGLFREILMAKYFGTGEVNGAYRIAQTGTLVPINFMTNETLNATFIPLYKKYLVENKNTAETFKWCMFVLFFIVSIFLWFVLFYCSGFWVDLLAPGVNEETSGLSVSLLKIMAICCPFYLCSSLMNYISMAHGDYRPMSMRSTFQNIGMLLGVVGAFYLNNFSLLAWGFTGSYMLFCFWSLTRANAANIIAFPEEVSWPEVMSVLKSFWGVLKPLLLLPMILQGNIALERALSSLVSLEAVSSLDYAKFITETVIFFLSVPIAFAGLSTWAGQDLKQVRRKLKDIYTPLLVLSGSVSFFIFFYAKDLVSLLFYRGEFDLNSVKTTTDFVLGICFGLWAQVIGYVFLKALSAHLKNKQVLITMIVSLSGNALFNLLSYKTWGAMGIGIGSSVYGILLLIMSSWYLGLIGILLRPLMKIMSGMILYLVVFYFFPQLSSLSSVMIINLLLNGLFFSVFIITWCMLFSEIRMSLLSTVHIKM